MKLLCLLLSTVSGFGCATAHLVGERAPRERVEAGPPRVVVVEPLFDRAEWKTSTRTDFVDPAGLGSATLAPPIAVTRTVTEKPLFARPPTMVAVHEQLLVAISLLRPHWTVVAPGAAPTITREAVVVRTVIDKNELVQSDRTLKNAAFAFGLVLLPLQILAAFPVEETERVSGLLEKVVLDPKALQQRLVKYATQPDFAVNFSGLAPKRQPFALDVEYEEGLFADEGPRPAVLVEGFVEKLAYAIVSLIEEEPP
ncbi:MAG: hypothetical protein IAE78_27285 [Myxococcus sp.]|nr:hypothetical protein [Myxococcus sp.]